MALNFGMPYGFAEALAAKYGIMRMQADAQANALNAAANKDNVSARLMPGQTEAEIGETKARTAGLLEQNKTIVPLAISSIGLQGSQSKLYDSQAGVADQDIVRQKQLNKQRPYGLGLGGSSDNTYGFGGYGFSF
jgi:hypothetical protein